MRLPVPRSVKFIVAICMSLVVANVSHAGTPRTPKPKPKPKIPYMAIASVDPTAMTITIESRNSTATSSKTFKFNAKTKVTVNGHDGTVSDLKPGLQIRVGTGSDETVADQLTATNPPADPNEGKAKGR